MFESQKVKCQQHVMIMMVIMITKKMFERWKVHHRWVEEGKWVEGMEVKIFGGLERGIKERGREGGEDPKM